MSCLIAGTLHIEPEDLDEDAWHKAWGRTKYYLETIHQVKFD